LINDFSGSPPSIIRMGVDQEQLAPSEDKLLQMSGHIRDQVSGEL